MEGAAESSGVEKGAKKGEEDGDDVNTSIISQSDKKATTAGSFERLSKKFEPKQDAI